MTAGTSVRRTVAATLALASLGGACALAASSLAAQAATDGAANAQALAATTATTPKTSFTAYTACLKSHGVTLPSGGGRGFFRPGAGGSRPKPTAAEQKALTACASLRPTGGGFGGFNTSSPAFAKFQACLKQHGVKLGTPGTPGGRSSGSSAGFAACRSLLPAGSFRGGAGGGAGGGANSTTFAKYQACLKQHGVQTGAAGQSPAKLQKALAACKSVLSGGSGKSGG